MDGFVISLSSPTVNIYNENENVKFMVDNSINYETFVRIKIIEPEGVDIIKQDSDDWYWNEDYFYCKNIVIPGENIQLPSIDVTTEKASGEKYILRFIAEAIETSYDEKGNKYADWNKKINILEGE